MGLFKKKIRVSVAQFIENEVERAIENADKLEQLVEQTSVHIVNRHELSIFAAVIPLLAMVHANLTQDVRLAYSATISGELEGRYPGRRAVEFNDRAIEYLEAAAYDIARDKAPLMPTVVETALGHIIGVTGPSVTKCHMVVLMFLQGIFVANVKFYRDLRILS